MKTNVVRSVVGLCLVVTAGVAACGGTDSAPSLADAAGGEGADASGQATDGEPRGDASTDVSAASFDARGADAACVLTETDAGCNAIDVGGPMVAATCSMAEPPQAVGGAIEDGFYVLQSFTYYGVCPTTPDIASTTWEICGDNWDVVQISLGLDAGPLPAARFDFVTSVQSSAVTYAQSCGAPVMLGPRPYSATPGHLTFVYPDATTPGRTFVSVFAKE